MINSIFKATHTWYYCTSTKTVLTLYFCCFVSLQKQYISLAFNNLGVSWVYINQTAKFLEISYWKKIQVKKQHFYKVNFTPHTNSTSINEQNNLRRTSHDRYKLNGALIVSFTAEEHQKFLFLHRRPTKSEILPLSYYYSIHSTEGFY